MAKNIIVTGGTKGIGKAIIENFAKKGFNIYTCSRNQDDLNILKEAIEKQFGVVCHTLKADLSNKTEVKTFADFIKESSQTIDILVNNVGFFTPGEVHSEPDGLLEDMMNANLFSAYNLTRHLIQKIISAKGHIFNICSIASITAYPNSGSYSITKFALYGFSKALREEMKEKQVRVTSVLPGAALTASWEGVDIPEERFMKASDIAATIENAYDLSERSVVEELIIRPQLGDI